MIIENMKLPEYSLTESIKFIEPVVFSNLSSITKDHFAKLRSFNASGGAFNLRLSSARLWGLITDGNPFKPTSLAKQIILSSDTQQKINLLYETSRNFMVFNKLSRDLNLNPSLFLNHCDYIIMHTQNNGIPISIFKFFLFDQKVFM